MTEIPTAEASEFGGWAVSPDDNTKLMLRFITPDGSEFALKMTHDTLDQMIVHLVNATAAFPSEKGLSQQVEFGMGVKTADVGFTPSTGQHFIRLRLPAGGHLLFNFSRVLFEGLHDAIGNELGLGPKGPPSGSIQN